MVHQSPGKDKQIASFISGNSGSSEIEDLRYRQNQSEKNKRLVEDSEKVWENSPKPLFQSDRERGKGDVKDCIIAQTTLLQKRVRVLLRTLRLAAILIGPIMLTVGWYIGSFNNNKKEIVWNAVKAPRKHIAMCTMADTTVLISFANGK